MSIRFLADENVRGDIIRGLRSREPAIDLLDVKTSGLRGTNDAALLEIAAQQRRIVVSNDSQTMTRHFWERVEAGKPSPGLFIVPQQASTVGTVIEWLLLVWAASQLEEWRDRIVYLPPAR